MGRGALAPQRSAPAFFFSTLSNTSCVSRLNRLQLGLHAFPAFSGTLTEQKTKSRRPGLVAAAVARGGENSVSKSSG